MTVCLFTVHMLFPAALAAMSSLHSKQPECTWAVGCSEGANTPKLWGAPGCLPPSCHRPGDRAPLGTGALGCGYCRRCPLQAEQGEEERVREGAGWGEAAGAARGRIDREQRGLPSARSAHRAANAQPAVAKAMALHRHSKLRRPHRSQV